MKKNPLSSMKCLLVSKRRYSRFFIRDVAINAGLRSDNIFEIENIFEINSSEMNFGFKVIIIDHDDNLDLSYMEILFHEEAFRNVPVIIVTSKASKNLVLKAIEKGVSGIILRPLRIGNMKKNLEKALDTSNRLIE